MKAVQCQREECAVILLKHGADPDLMDSLGNTALHHAVCGQKISIAAQLLLHHADIEARNGERLTPLLLAVKTNNQPMVEFLVQKGANIHAFDEMKRTALMFAVNYRSTNTVRLLLEQGIDADCEDVFGKTAEEYVLASGCYSHLQLLYKYTEPKTPTDSSLTNNPGKENSEDDPLSRLCDIPGPNDSWPSSIDDLDFDTKNVPKIDVTKLIKTCPLWQSTEIQQAKYYIQRPESKTLLESISENLPQKYAGHSPGAADQRGKNIVNGQGEGLSAEQDFKMTAEEEQEKLDGNENKEPQDKVTLKTATPTEKTSENQTKQLNLPLLQVQKMSQEPEMNKDRNREDIPVYPGHLFMQKYEGGWIQQEKLEWKNNSQVITSELKQRFGEICEKYRIAACSEEEPLRDNFKGGADLKKIPSNLTNNMLDCEGKDAFGFSGALQAFPEQKEDPSLKNIFPPHSHSGSPEYACQSSSKLYLNENKLDRENNKPDTEFVFNTNENLCNDTENKKGRNQEVVTVEVKEDQEFDRQMTKHMIQNTTDGELDIGHVPQSSDPKSLYDVWLTHSSEMKHMSQIKGQRTAVTEPYKKAKLTKDLFQKPLNDRCSANNYKSMEPELQNVNSSPRSGTTSKLYLNEELEDIQRFKNETGMLQIEFLALEKDKVQVQKEVDDEEKKQHRRNEMEISENLYDGAAAAAAAAADGLIQQRKNGRNDNWQFPVEENEEYDSSPALSMMELKKNEKEIWTSEDSVIVPMLEKANLLTGGPLQVNGNSRLGKIDQDEGRFAFKQEKENRRDADIVCDRLRNLLRRTEEQCSADAAARRLEVTLRTQDAELRAVRDNWNPISDSHTKDLWHKNDMLQDEIAKLRLEIDTIKNQYQEKEKKYSRDIEIVKEKSDDLQKIMKLNEETSAKKIFQYIGQIRVLTDENTVLNSKLENEKQNKERLEREVESYHSRLPAAIQDHDQSQISERDLELALQKAEDECFHLQEKMNFDLSKLKHKNEFLSQKLSKAESRSNSLKIEFHHTRDALREKTLVLEGVKRDLSQTQCQMKETEHMYHNEQSKVNECTGKQESVEERLSPLQHENVLLRQQLDEARNKADHKEKTVINIQHQCHDIVRKPQAQSKKGSLIVEERNKELINECNHLKEKLHHYENEKTEREVAVRPVQHKLADTLKKQPTSEASLEVTSCHQIDLEDETKDLKKRLCEIQSQVDGLTAQLEAASSNCLHLDAENQFLKKELLSMKKIQKKCEHLEKKEKKLEQVVVNLQNHMEMNMVERRQVEQYKQEIEEKARQDVVETLKEVNLFLQEQAAFQEDLEKLRENKNASIRSQMELRIKDLESELMKMKNFLKMILMKQNWLNISNSI